MSSSRKYYWFHPNECLSEYRQAAHPRPRRSDRSPQVVIRVQSKPRSLNQTILVDDWELKSSHIFMFWFWHTNLSITSFGSAKKFRIWTPKPVKSLQKARKYCGALLCVLVTSRFNPYQKYRSKPERLWIATITCHEELEKYVDSLL